MSSLLRFLLLPFSILYGAGVFLRNKLFDLNIRKSVSFDLPVLAVGNLSAGGTGKTPHVEYLIRLLREKYKIGMMSRGYKRKTKGYFLADENSTPSQTGDEPLQIKRKFSDVMVAVCEERVMGIPNMLADDPLLQVIILDDAFQHRNVKAGLSVLLTEYSKPYSADWLIPAGRLREWKSGADRADMIIVTKGPANLTSEEKKMMINELKPKSHQPVFFSAFRYNTPYHIFQPEKKYSLSREDDALLFCGIADPALLVDTLEKKCAGVELIRFEDHHRYSLDDLKKIQSKFSVMPSPKKILVTTEKDAVRLLPFRDFLMNQRLEIYCVPIEVFFLEDEKKKFDEMILSFIEKSLSESYDQPA